MIEGKMFENIYIDNNLKEKWKKISIESIDTFRDNVKEILDIYIKGPRKAVPSKSNTVYKILGLEIN